MLERIVDIVMNLRTYKAPSTPAPLLIAHRGAWDHSTQENTLAAFEHAQKLGAWGIELDVRFSADDVPVVHHDPTLQRVHGLNTVIHQTPWDELQRQTNQLSPLREIVQFKKLHFMIELKTRLNAVQQQVLVETLGHLRPREDYHLLALHPDLVFEKNQITSQAWVLVGEYNLPHYTNLCLQRNFGGVAGHYLLLHNGLVQKLHKAGKKAGVGFVPTKNLMCREHGRGIDWIFTNTLAQLT